MMMKKIFGLVILVFLILSATANATDQPQQTVMIDIEGHWAKDSILQAIALGYVSGYPDDTFKPKNQVTRAEFIKMIVDVLKLPHSQGGTPWYQPYVAVALEQHLHSESDFKDYSKPITRMEMARIVAKGLALTEDYQTYLDAYKNLYNGDLPFTDYRDFKQVDVPYLALAFGTKIIMGYPDLSFGIDKPATRAEAVVMLNNLNDVRKHNPQNYQYLQEMKEVAEYGTNAETVSTLRHQEETNLLTDVKVDHPNYTAVLKRVYVVPFTGTHSMYERKFVSNMDVVKNQPHDKDLFERTKGFYICVMDFTPKKDGDANLYATNLSPNTVYMYHDTEIHEKFQILNWYMDGMYLYKKGTTYELSLYATTDRKVPSLDLDYTINGKQRAYGLLRNPLNP